MIRLSYISQAARDFSDEELDAMLEKFRANNRARDITGVLYHGNGMFMQVLEGPKEAVEETFRRIRKDPRHHDVRLIEKTPIEKRRFGDFSMAFSRLKDEDFTRLAREMGASEEVLKRQQALIEELSRHLKQEADKRTSHMELPLHHEDRLIRSLHRVIHMAVKGLAVLMTLVIVWGVFDVVWVLYQRFLTPPLGLLEVSDIIAVFGAFIAVLIAIEIFINITLYLRSDVMPVRLVVATALMAIARKVIILDFKKLDWPYVAATGVVVLALGVTYWLLHRMETGAGKEEWKK